MRRRYDAVVAGAGCAGSLLAARLASRGFGVLLLDRKARVDMGQDARSLIEPGAFDLCGLDPPLPPEAGPSPRAVVAISPDTLTSVTVRSPALVFVDRRLLAARLLDLAVSSGAELMTECLAAGLELEAGRVVGVRTERGVYECSLAVDATGNERALCGSLPSATGIPRQIRPSDCLLMYQERRRASGEEPSAELEPGVLKYYYGRFGGFGSAYRDEEGGVDVRAAVKAVSASPDPRTIVHGFIRSSLEIGIGVLGSAGGRVAARRPLDTMVAAGLMLVGDAACQAMPISGRGVEGALRGASLAAETAASALESGETGTEALWGYNRAYIAGRGAELAALDCVRLFFQRLTEEEVSRGMATGIIGPREVRSALVGRVDFPSVQARARSIIRAVRELPLLVRADAVLRNARRARELYSQYPATYDPPEFTEWRQEAALLFEDVERG